jgi:hypothetical protein
VRSRAFTTRLAALMGVGSLAVHQLRFVLWYGKSADGVLSSQGHAYLAVVGPVVVVLTVLGVARFVRRLALGARGAAPALVRLWGTVSASLLAMYSLQELIEGALSSGHPAGLTGIVGDGGWLAVPLSLVVGLALALALRGAAHAAELIAGRGSVRPPLPAAPLVLDFTTSFVPRREPLLAAASPRGPPAASA